MPQLPDPLMNKLFPNGFDNTTRNNRKRVYGEFLCLEILRSIKQINSNCWLSSEDCFEIYQNVTKRKFFSLSKGSFSKYLASLRSRNEILSQKISIPASYSVSKRNYYHLDDLTTILDFDKSVIHHADFEAKGKKLGISPSQFEFNTENGKFFLKEEKPGKTRKKPRK